MNIQEFYQIILEEQKGENLELTPITCDGVFLSLWRIMGQISISECEIKLLTFSVMINGKCVLPGWNNDYPFQIQIECREKEARIEWKAMFWSTFSGKIGDFLGYLSPESINIYGETKEVSLVGEFQISMPVISYDTQEKDRDLRFPLSFSATAFQSGDTWWEKYSDIIKDIYIIRGKLNRNGSFKFELPMRNVLKTPFNFVESSLIFQNRIKNVIIHNSIISEIGINLKLVHKMLGEVSIIMPLRGNVDNFSLYVDLKRSLTIANIIDFLMAILRIDNDKIISALPQNILFSHFSLEGLNIFVHKKENLLSAQYLSAQFSLNIPWKLPVPYVTLEHLGVGFEVSFGNGTKLSDGTELGDLLTASAGGTLSIELGKYKLFLTLEMDLPETNFMAQTRLEKSSNNDAPGIVDLTQTFDVTLPDELRKSKNLLGEITVYGSGTSRDFSIVADAYDIISFNVGKLEIKLDQLEAGASVSTSDYSFYVQGIMGLKSGEKEFSLYLKASYNNPGWIFAGGLYHGTFDLVDLLAAMFGYTNVAPDFLGINLTELEVIYKTETKALTFTAAFYTGWHVTLLGKDLILGGRLQVIKEGNQNGQEIDIPADVSALAYLSLGSFLILAQVNHIQLENREYLFRVEYKNAFLQAAYFLRNKEEILTVNLGGMTVGSLLESLVQMINPNKKYSLPAPWNLLNRIDLSKFLLEINMTQNTASFMYHADLNIAGLMYVDKIGVRYTPEASERKLAFVLTGKLLGITYGEDNPIEWDAIDGEPPVDSAENQKKFELSYLGLGQHLQYAQAVNAASVAEAISELKTAITEQVQISELKYSAENDWLFGVDFTVNSALNVQLVLYDPVLYGLLVTVKAQQGSILSAFNGFGLELLCKRVSDQVYMFRGEVMIPAAFRRFQLGVLSLTLGTICAEIYTNGGFYVDLGFPHNMDFSRSFVLEWNIFTGRGGIYFGVMKDIARPNLPEIQNDRGNFSPIVELGIGLSIGLGRSFDFGIVKGGVSAEVFGILEGVFAIFHQKNLPAGEERESTYYYVRAVVGISGRLYLSVDFKIITVQASAEIMASADMILQAYRATTIELALALKIQASIKILFIKIKFSFSFRETVKFTLGEDTRAPWEESVSIAEKVGYMPRKLEPLKVVSQVETVIHRILPLEYTTGTNGTALLMVTEKETQEIWTKVFALWLLSGMADEQGKIGAEKIACLDEAKTTDITYDQAIAFIRENISASVMLERSETTETDGYIFPMFPPLEIDYKDTEAVPSIFWKDSPVDSSYFSNIREYFQQTNPDPTYSIPENAAGADFSIPIAKVFFLDYIQMYLRELIGRIRSMYDKLSVPLDDKIGILYGKYGVDGAELLKQNPGLMFLPGIKLDFHVLTYISREGDSVSKIADKWNISLEEAWDTLQAVDFFLRKEGELRIEDYSYHNAVTKLTLKQAAALVYVRFYENAISDDMFYVSDIIRMNERNLELAGIDLNWEQVNQEGYILNLPVFGADYITLLGDTLQRIAKFVYLLQAKEGSEPLWEAFYQEVKAKNPGSTDEAVLETIAFGPAVIQVGDIRNLGEFLRRICPDGESGLKEQICNAQILKANFPVKLENASYTLQSEGSMSVSEVQSELGCTYEELEQAISEAEQQAEGNIFVQNQNMVINQVAYMEQEELVQRVILETDSIGSTMSRFLLQGLRVPAPDDSRKIVPLYEALGLMYTGEIIENCIGTVNVTENGCDWLKVEGNPELYVEMAVRDGLLLCSNAETKIGSLEDSFSLSDQYLTLPKSAVCYSGNSQIQIYRLSKGNAEIVNADTSEPLFIDGYGNRHPVKWGCILPVVIGKSGTEFVYQVYGADCEDRRILHELLHTSQIKLHVLFQESELSQGGQTYWEYDWMQEESFLVKTNLSVETHMGVGNGDDYQYITNVEQTSKFLRILWECSTVGGGGYFLRLKSRTGQILPENIFDEDGRGTLWILVENPEFSALAGNINCCITSEVSETDREAVLMTTGEKSKLMEPRFPVGCIGITWRQNDAAKDGNLSETQEYLEDMHHVGGYHIVYSDTEGKECVSNSSAPILPRQEGNAFLYHAVIPLYRFTDLLENQSMQSPYRAVGKNFRIVCEERDLLGNLFESDEQTAGLEVVADYNDLLIGIGQWPATQISYAILPGTDRNKPVLRLTLTPIIKDKGTWEASAIYYQRMAAWQISCGDIRVELTSPVSDQKFMLNEVISESEDQSYLSLLQKYASALVDSMETGTVPVAWSLDFELDLDMYPLKKSIFVMVTVLSIIRMVHTEKQEEESLTPARKADTVIWPYYGENSVIEKNPYPSNLRPFCKKAREAMPALWFAQGAEGENILYGVPFDLGAIQISDFMYEGIHAPEYLALRPLANQMISRTVKIHEVTEQRNLSEQITKMDMPDTDMEILASTFLGDIERLLLAGQIQRIGVLNASLLDRLIKAKERLAEAISMQLTSLYAGEILPAGDLEKVRAMIQDKLKRSLTDGYTMDVIARFGLSFAAPVPEKDHFRITASVSQQVTGTQISAGKVDSSAKDFYLYFHNNSQKRSIPFSADLVLNELEYDITEDQGYESSRWIRLVEPVVLQKADVLSEYLKPQIYLPNPLKHCPQPPILQSHICQIDTNKGENGILAWFSADTERIGWDYSLKLRYRYAEQDIISLRIEFEDILRRQIHAEGQDLFDVLSEYTLAREKLWEPLNQVESDPNIYQSAFESVTRIAETASDVWEDWLNQSEYVSQSDGTLVYSCMIQGMVAEKEMMFNVTDTEEGAVFLRQMGVQTPIVEVTRMDDATGEMELLFAMKHLPLFQCAYATPVVKIIRNQNLLTGENIELPVNEKFIYRTQEVSLPTLPVAGEYTNEYLIATIPVTKFSEDTMIQAASALYAALQLDHQNLAYTLSVSYYYGLSKGKDIPRISLPVTLFPYMDAVSSEGEADAQIQRVGRNLYAWFSEMQPDTNHCGLLFDVRIYNKDEEKELLHFSSLSIKFDIEQ